MKKEKWIRIEKIDESQWIVSWYNPSQESKLPARPTCQFSVNPADSELPTKLGAIFLPQISPTQHFLFRILPSGKCVGWLRKNVE